MDLAARGTLMGLGVFSGGPGMLSLVPVSAEDDNNNNAINDYHAISLIAQLFFNGLATTGSGEHS
jgi:hypothetical protein